MPIRQQAIIWTDDSLLMHICIIQLNESIRNDVDCFTVSQHSSDGIQIGLPLPAAVGVQGTISAFWKLTVIPTSLVSPQCIATFPGHITIWLCPIYIHTRSNHSSVNPSHVPYPTDKSSSQQAEIVWQSSNKRWETFTAGSRNAGCPGSLPL